MPLIPGRLPPGTCYGTPQQMLEVFSQHLSTTGSEQGTLYTTTSAVPTVVDPLEPFPRIWVDRTTANSPIVKVYGGDTGQNWVQAGAQTLFKQFGTLNTLGANTDKYAFEAFTLPPRSIIHWIAYYVAVKFVPTASPSADTTVNLLLDPGGTENPFIAPNLGTVLGTSIDVNPAGALPEKPSFVPGLTGDTFGKYSTTSKVWAQFGPNNSTFSAGLVNIWLNFSQLQG